MLARKYYAQRGVNRDSYNRVAISASSSYRLNKLKRQQTDNSFKEHPRNDSSIHLKILLAEKAKCEGKHSNSNNNNNNDPENNNGKKNNMCETIQNNKTKTQGDYIKENVFCPLPLELRKPVIKNMCSVSV